MKLIPKKIQKTVLQCNSWLIHDPQFSGQYLKLLSQHKEIKTKYETDTYNHSLLKKSNIRSLLKFPLQCNEICFKIH